ncbi:hypothetical protein C4C32_27255 [Pseudomonas corrugata]|uniref:Uncharacterized protein n=1 Tax=Pseudomonas corrugata TaxID=47879 RepID=A0A8B6UQL2_9PSED|nr:hypothetical protein [Pseudomonas corrugata]QTH14189.1 hypothetical protein C4C32_27255 [Pseudomonas corrugata]
MFKVTPNPPNSAKSRVEASEAKKHEDAATRALDYYLNPQPSPPEADKHQLFIVAPHIDTETLLADDVDDSRRCIALAISRMADGVQLLVERALDRLEAQETAAG